jgi:hypothetical protein
VDEGVYPIYPYQCDGVLEEEVLDWEFPEYVEGLFEVNYLEGMFAGNVDGSFDEGYGGEGAA